MTVLLLEPDQRARRSEAAALRYGGYDVAPRRTLEQAFRFLRARQPDAVVVDPAPSNAAQVAAELRQRTETPIIVISEAGGEWDAVAALDAGADDYLSKPFGAEVLVARLRAVLRRTQRSEDEELIVMDDLMIDRAARRFFRADGSEIRLTGVELRILEILLRHPGHLVENERLFEEVWGTQGVRKPHILRVYVARIRRKLEPDPAHPRYLLSAKGLGLIFAVEQGAERR